MDNLYLGVLAVEKTEKRVDLGDLVAPVGSYILTNVFGRKTAVSGIVFERLSGLIIEEPEVAVDPAPPEDVVEPVKGATPWPASQNISVPDGMDSPSVGVEVPRDDIDA